VLTEVSHECFGVRLVPFADAVADDGLVEAAQADEDVLVALIGTIGCLHLALLFADIAPEFVQFDHGRLDIPHEGIVQGSACETSYQMSYRTILYS